jgi:ABC-type Zn2+ transport system substrate-binding protein/surface adhesin
MRRLIPTLLIAAGVLLGTLPLGGCIVAPHRDHGHSSHRDGPHRHHDRGHDHDRGYDHDRDHGHR